MSISVDSKVFLKELGVDSNIIKILDERSIPQENLFWKESNYYIDSKIRFYLIPISLCLLLDYKKVKLDKIIESLNFLETILHISEEEELVNMTFDQCVNEIRLLKVNKSNFNFILKTIKDDSRSNTLKRGSYVAFYFSFFQALKTTELKEILETFMSLISFSCILDDLYDIKIDSIHNNPNILLEYNFLNNPMASYEELEIIAKKELKIIKSFDSKISSFLNSFYKKSILYSINNIIDEQR